MILECIDLTKKELDESIQKHTSPKDRFDPSIRLTLSLKMYHDECSTISSKASSQLPNVAYAESFLATLQAQVPPFLAQVVTTLKEVYGLDVSDYSVDHVCWRTETWTEYTQLIEALKEQEHQPQGKTRAIFHLLIESEVGGRLISTFELAKDATMFLDETNGNHGDDCKKCHRVSVIEIPSPKPGSPYPSGLEHVEFILPPSSDGGSSTANDIVSPLNDDVHQQAFQTLMKLHPHLPWNTKAMKSKAINPDISLSMELRDVTTSSERRRTCSAKFHLVPLADVIASEKILSYNDQS